MSGQVIHVDEMPDFLDSRYIGRPMPRQSLKGSILRNPYHVATYGRAMALAKYLAHLEDQIKSNPRFVEALIECRDRALACWCRRSTEECTKANACHGDLIIATLKAFTDDELRSLARQEKR